LWYLTLFFQMCHRCLRDLFQCGQWPSMTWHFLEPQEWDVILGCEDFLCTDCNRHHFRSSSSKQHIVISMENYQKLPSSILSIKNRCTKHGNKYE
jgi:hypothetical protein